MINIDEEDLEEETLEDRVFEKADYIGEVLTGERKIHFKLPERKQKPKPKPKRSSRFTIFVNNFRRSLLKYKEMSLARLIGLSILLILSITVIAVIGYLLLLLLAGLLKLGLIGLIGFSFLMCALSVSTILIIASRYSRQ